MGSVSAAYVELRLAGTFRVVRGGTELTDGEIGSRKSRTLLKLLAVAAAERAHELLSAGTAIGDEPYADWADPAREVRP